VFGSWSSLHYWLAARSLRADFKSTV
jgi:hypothetical protein